MAKSKKFVTSLLLLIIIAAANAISVSAVAEHVIYGPAPFNSLDAGGVTTKSFTSDGNDVQINAQASKDNSSSTGTYQITLLKWDWFNGRYFSKGTVNYTYAPGQPTYVYTWTGVGTGTYAATIQRLSSDTGTISGSLTVYAKN
jgi:uncharacterized cupin superfamily protein